MVITVSLVLLATAAQTPPSVAEEVRANDVAAALMSRMEPDRGSAERDGEARPSGPCTDDGRIHADGSAAAIRPVMAAIRLRLPGARVRGATRLTLPCGFRLDPRSGADLILTDGRQYRRYVENNPFGFAPPFGFGDAPRSYSLTFTVVPEAELRAAAPCPRLRGAEGAAICAGFGASTFAAIPRDRAVELVHLAGVGEDVATDFHVATIAMPVDGLSFMPPPDAPGGTITAILRDRDTRYRVFIDVPRG